MKVRDHANKSNIFDDLFILEMANNHWGSLDRGKRIIRSFAQIVRKHGVKAAIKMQFRDVDTFIHPDFRGDEERYIKKTELTQLSIDDFCELSELIAREGCIPMATPFDEKSVGLCEDLKYKIIKIASSDINDWNLLNRISVANRPVIISTGGAKEHQIDAAVLFFNQMNIPLAINHCVSLYPSDDDQLELSQIDYLKSRYPDNVIGLSTHECTDWSSSLLMSYAKGARTWERHIDIEDGERKVSPYCSLPHQIDEWFCAYKKAKEMNGSTLDSRRHICQKETDYLNNLARGIYARGKVPRGTIINDKNFHKYFFLAVPLQRGQLSGRENICGARIARNLQQGEGLFIGSVGNLDYLNINTGEIINRGRKTTHQEAFEAPPADTKNLNQAYMTKLHIRMAQ
ncbi:N-acetylneuraminate synthase family protein [Alphaproteobacteria bacterium]|nr:N-acetylneuraminate synthase family protein [Alphaproteobacteria bacterium]